MTKSSKHIEIVSSTSIGLGSMGVASREAAKSALEQYYDSVVITIVNNLDDLKALVLRKPDLVFLGMKFIPLNPELGQFDPNKIWLAQYFDEWDITYTGSTHAAHVLELNKDLAKQQVLDNNLCTSPFMLIPQGSIAQIKDKLTYPLFVKPSNRGGGVGISADSLVLNTIELNTKVAMISDTLHSDALIEQFLPGREFSVAILKKPHSDGYYIMPIELVGEPAADQTTRILSSEVKNSNSSEVLTVRDPALHQSLSNLAIGAFHAIGARDYGRIDIRLDRDGTPHFLEANLIPSLISGYGSFPLACDSNYAIDYEEMLCSIVTLALSRSNSENDNAEDTSDQHAYNAIDIIKV